MATKNLNIEGASIGIDEKGMEAYRDAIQTAILQKVSNNIVNKFQYEIAPGLREAWGGFYGGARDRFINQMNQDMINLQRHIVGLQKQVNIAFSDAIKKFSALDNNFNAGRRIN